jgi:hypothetical protein
MGFGVHIRGTNPSASFMFLFFAFMQASVLTTTNGAPIGIGWSSQPQTFIMEGTLHVKHIITESIKVTGLTKDYHDKKYYAPSLQQLCLEVINENTYWHLWYASRDYTQRALAIYYQLMKIYKAMEYKCACCGAQLERNDYWRRTICRSQHTGDGYYVLYNISKNYNIMYEDTWKLMFDRKILSADHFLSFSLDDK